ncbi:MAG TPA: DsbE family thiol:disulfide interchange protein [Acidiferrobacteraceae bacterium]|nr:DsbE family thiol:disulfide interchange protein [Acidiferrobacteraceae bacterium]HEX19912.1 DsbE family thiol:disulfide interchange protein [Acidiferrobacteraceae bacterium]
MLSRYVIPLVITILILVLLGIGLTMDPKLIPSVLIGKPAPEFALPTVRNPKITLSKSDLQGKVVLFNVWASWCTACKEEHPIFMELARRKAVPIYGLNYKDKRKDALSWLRQLGDPYVASAHDANGRVGIDWGVYGVPETFVVDRKGIIRYKHVGALNAKVVEQKIMPLVRRLRTEKP